MIGALAVQRLRALPVAVLLAVVVAAVAVRLGRSPHVRAPRSPEQVVAANVEVAPLERPLVGAPPPLDAEVPEGPPPMIHGGPRHTHRAAARGPSAVRVGYRVEVGGPVAAQVVASPDEETLYAATLEGEVVALARRDGTKRWKVALGDRVYSTPFVGEDGTLYVGTDARKVVAIAPDGAVRWRLEVDGEADTGPAPLPDGALVVAAGPSVYAVRRRGDVAWRYTAKGKVFTAPAVTPDGLVVFGSQDDHVHAVTREGVKAWSVDLGADVDGAPAIGDDGSIWVGTDRGEVVRLDAQGRVLSRTDVGGYVRGVLSVARSGDALAGTYGPVPRVVRVSPQGAVLGAFAIQGTGSRDFGVHGGPLEDVDGTLYFGTQDDAVYAVALDGTVRWRFETGADVDAPLTMLRDGSLVVPSEDGTVTMLLP